MVKRPHEQEANRVWAKIETAARTGGYPQRAYLRSIMGLPVMDRRGRGSSPQGTPAIFAPTALDHEGTGFLYGYLIYNKDNDQAKR